MNSPSFCDGMFSSCFLGKGFAEIEWAILFQLGLVNSSTKVVINLTTSPSSLTLTKLQ
jgi:hypothetical protein